MFHHVEIIPDTIIDLGQVYRADFYEFQTNKHKVNLWFRGSDLKHEFYTTEKMRDYIYNFLKED